MSNEVKELVVDPKDEGAFFQSLARNQKSIRKDRAENISEEVQLSYRRSVEDQRLVVSRLKRKAINNLDMSPDNAMSLVLAKDLDAPLWVEEDIKLQFDIHNEGIKLTLAEERYIFLFGEAV